MMHHRLLHRIGIVDQNRSADGRDVLPDVDPKGLLKVCSGVLSSIMAKHARY